MIDNVNLHSDPDAEYDFDQCRKDSGKCCDLCAPPAASPQRPNVDDPRLNTAAKLFNFEPPENFSKVLQKPRMNFIDFLPLPLVISLDDFSSLLNLLYTGFPTPIRFGMNVTKVGVGFRLGRNVDFQTLVELGSLVTTSTTPAPRRNVRQQLGPSGQAEVSSGAPLRAEFSTGAPRRAEVSSGAPGRAELSSGAPRRTEVSSGTPRRAEVSSDFFNGLWGRRPSVRAPVRTKPPPSSTTSAPQTTDWRPDDVIDNEIDS